MICGVLCVRLPQRFRRLRVMPRTAWIHHLLSPAWSPRAPSAIAARTQNEVLNSVILVVKEKKGHGRQIDITVGVGRSICFLLTRQLVPTICLYYSVHFAQAKNTGGVMGHWLNFSRKIFFLRCSHGYCDLANSKKHRGSFSSCNVALLMPTKKSVHRSLALLYRCSRLLEQTYKSTRVIF